MAYREGYKPKKWTWCISYREWVNTYKPTNENLPFVPKDIDPSFVWSEVWCDDVQTIVPSIHFINVTGYAVTEIPHDENTKEVFVAFTDTDY